MAITTNVKSMVCALSLVVLASCTSNTPQEQPPTTDSSNTPPAASTDTGSNSNTNVGTIPPVEREPDIPRVDLSRGPLDANGNPLTNIVYFDFDQSVIRPEGRRDLAAHSRFLNENPRARVILEGHCDERGTREYNLALGERRAKAVENFLLVRGASRTQLELISYGEEQPVDPRGNDRAWSQNRRVEIKYQIVN